MATAWELVERYQQEHNALPPTGEEVVKLCELANTLDVVAPDDDALLSVVQMLRQREQEDAQRLAGQMTLI